MPSLLTAEAAVAILTAHTGFPDARLAIDESVPESYLVRWGDDPPRLDHQARGYHFGYTNDAIASYMRHVHTLRTAAAVCT